ncbi:MAG: type VI secretion system tube protein Hcp [Pirellulaceae bacterium]|nr:type VI secretion system tube protein Hcp [Pirellulaceae bacterium]
MIFAKYQGIDGQAQDKGHEKWIAVESIDWGATTPGSRTGGSYTAQDLSITYAFDISAPKLAEKLLKGEKIDELEIHTTATYGDGSENTYLTIKMTNVFISSFQVSGSGDGGKPYVSVSNNAETIEVKYTEFKEDDGKKGGNAELSKWSLVKRAKA